ncbi:MAG: PBP1A family penicillin-binding protein [Proteobacteria bacterium]|nr:PBP1A family penicillin-binding protein [Pseudomonadota bacterium]
MKAKNPHLTWRGLLRTSALVLLIVGVGLVLYCWHLSVQIETRFSGRLWSIPSRVLSDTTMLYPGQKIRKTVLIERLHRLGYREVFNEPAKKGELHISASAMKLFLHDLNAPHRKREGFPVQIQFSENRIESISRADGQKPVPLLELEPEEMMLFFGPDREKRQLVSLDRVPQHLIHAVLAAEDSRFFHHFGLDPRGILRALYTNLRHGTIRQGGSTITQQLAKNYFLTPERTVSRKVKELLMAITIELMYDKRRILEIYLNEIYLGQKGQVSINGVGEASYFYFGKPAGELSLGEAATIAGLIKAPNHYSPYVDGEASRIQRDNVLHGMVKNGWLSGEEMEAALSLPVETVGFTTYGKKAPYFIDYLSQQLLGLYQPESLSSLGLSIYTTLDPMVQDSAEKALERGLTRLEKSKPMLNRSEAGEKLQGAIVVMQPKTGYILAMVGGRNYGVSQFNRISQARRQPGSAFKPFVFVSGLDTLTPASTLSNEPKSYMINGKLWEPQNFEPQSGGRVSLRSALAKSINLATVDLAIQVGLDRIVTTTAQYFSKPFKPYPSLSLGAFEVAPLDLARAYCAFAADGALPYPLSLKDVVDENGQILERRHMSVRQVTSPAKAFLINSMLRTAVTEGTAQSLEEMGISFPVAGKTGTTNDFRDSWFVGYTPDVLALVWVGFDNGDSIDTTGAGGALPIWADLMRTMPEHVSGEWFKTPPGVVKRVVCSESGLLAVPNACPQPVEEVFLEENVPETYCPLHRSEGPFKALFNGFKDLIKSF